jgi:Ni/Fe-hydrogenase subunit HybB-like protein/mono/diheme cytochrome c family protein
LGQQQPGLLGWPIVNFVFWVGIGHAGTLISAILCLFRQQWRTSINRFAEAMTIFAVVCAGIFPGIHVGRVWAAYWLAPYPSTHLAMWPNFRSPLLWDVFAVDLRHRLAAVLVHGDDSRSGHAARPGQGAKWRQILYGIAGPGLDGSARHWSRYEKAYMLLAALATPLVLSVHSVVSFDFAVSQVPGWHTTIFPPYFVAGAVFSGFAMVITLMVPARELFGLKDWSRSGTWTTSTRFILATGTMVGYAYMIEFFIAWYGGNAYERFAFINRAFRAVCVGLLDDDHLQRDHPAVVLVQEVPHHALDHVHRLDFREHRHVVRAVRDHRHVAEPRFPAVQLGFAPTWVDIGMFIGSFGLFFTLFLLFIRFMPMVAISEVKAVTGSRARSTHIESIYEQVATPMPRFFRPAVVVVALIALFPLAYIAMSRGGTSQIPRLSIWWDMDYQPRFGSQTLVKQAERPNFGERQEEADEDPRNKFNEFAFPMGRASRVPVAGTVARGHLRVDQRLLTGIEPSGEPTEPIALVMTGQADQPPAGEEPATDEPSGEEPATDEPSGEEPATEEPESDQPATDDPPGEEPATDEPSGEEPATDEPATEQPASGQPVGEEPGDEPMTEEPAGEEPASEAPATEEPATETPADEAPAATPATEPAADPPAGDAGAAAAPVDNTPWVTTFPEGTEVTRAAMERGRQRFNIYCAACHGRGGEGNGLVSQRAMQLQKGTWTQASNLHSDTIRDQPVGKIYNTITFGSNKGEGKMPGYSEQISLEDRWAITLYVKALQRSRTSTPDELPEDLRPAP